MPLRFPIHYQTAGPSHIELDEPVPGVEGNVEIVTRSVPVAPVASVPDIFDVIASLSPGGRSKEEIDHQIAEERASWGDR
jgi:hypothetical protein